MIGPSWTKSFASIVTFRLFSRLLMRVALGWEFYRLGLSIPVTRHNPKVNGALDILTVDAVSKIDALLTFLVGLVEKGETSAGNLHVYLFHRYLNILWLNISFPCRVTVSASACFLMLPYVSLRFILNINNLMIKTTQ